MEDRQPTDVDMMRCRGIELSVAAAVVLDQGVWAPAHHGERGSVMASPCSPQSVMIQSALHHPILESSKPGPLEGTLISNH